MQIQTGSSKLHGQTATLVAMFLALLLAPSRASAQAAAQTQPPSPPAGLEAPPAASAPKSNEDVLRMDPFEVVTSKDTSYGALNSNSITRFNTELYKTPVVADVFTQQFLQDTQVQSVEDLFANYGTGSGLVLATPESDSNATQPGDRFSVGQYALRGVSAGNAHRDGFDFSPTNTNATSTFDIERVDILHGAQGLLYGATGAGGVVNIQSKQASFNQQRGSISTRVDKYGSKSALGDFNWGNDWAAVRLVGIQQNNNYRRLYIGDTTTGTYGQMAFKLPFGNTTSTLRIMGEESHNNRQVPNNVSVNFGGTANDPRSGDKLEYLYVSNQLGTINPVTGQPFVTINPITKTAYPTPVPIDNWLVTNQNMESFAGWRTEEDQDNNIYEMSLDTNWTKWLSTSFGVLYDKTQEMRGTNIGNLSAPLQNGNPFNDWAIGSSMVDSESPSRKKNYRAAALFTFDVGPAHTQTAVGFDREYSDSSGGLGDAYYLANPDGSVTQDITKNNLGRTPLPTLWWPVAAGPVEYPFPKVGAKYIVVNGQLYARMPTNPRSSAWVTPNNPLGLASLFPGSTGVSGGNSGGFAQQRRDEGWYIANYTGWFNDRIDTLLGYRQSDSFTRNANTSTTIQQAYIEKRTGNLPSYNAGVDVRILSWLRGYYNYSRTFNFSVGSLSPLGIAPTNPTGWAHEGGIKFTNASGTISGSLSVYLTESLNDNYNAGTNFENTVNPSGLNGSLVGPDGSKNQWAQFDKKSRGIELILTASPTPEWRIRWSASVADGTVLKDSKYPILYNDQFYTDASGNVLYANGQPFLVPSDPVNLTIGGKKGLNNQSTPVNPATYGVAMQQLTVAMMNNPASPYYAYGFTAGQTTFNPANESLNGSIGGPVGGTLGTQYLKTALQQFRFGSNTGPSALTGVTGLPISAIQYNWADPANYGGEYVVQAKGNYTVGYPVYSTNIETNYTFSRGPLKGFGVGGTMALAWYYRTYYFATADRVRHLYSRPMANPTINLLLAYERKFRRFTLQTQLNVFNVFNRYTIGIFPNNGTGYTNAANVGATYYGEPRNYVWSTKFSF